MSLSGGCTGKLLVGWVRSIRSTDSPPPLETNCWKAKFTVVDAGHGRIALHNPRFNRDSEKTQLAALGQNSSEGKLMNGRLKRTDIQSYYKDFFV